MAPRWIPTRSTFKLVIAEAAVARVIVPGLWVGGCVGAGGVVEFIGPDERARCNVGREGEIVHVAGYTARNRDRADGEFGGN